MTRIVTHYRSPNGTLEQAIILDEIPQGKYSKKIRKKKRSFQELIFMMIKLLCVQKRGAPAQPQWLET